MAVPISRSVAGNNCTPQQESPWDCQQKTLMTNLIPFEHRIFLVYCIRKFNEALDPDNEQHTQEPKNLCRKQFLCYSYSLQRSGYTSDVFFEHSQIYFRVQKTKCSFNLLQILVADLKYLKQIFFLLKTDIQFNLAVAASRNPEICRNIQT